MKTNFDFSEISKTETNRLTEENVKIRIVLEILKELGYSGSDLLLEHNFGTDRPDIVIKDEMPIIIEVKGSNEDISAHIQQIKRYSYNFRSLISILTNGKHFYIFNPFWKRKSFFDTIIYSFNLNELNNDRTKEVLANLLGKHTNFNDKEKFINKLEIEILKKEKRKSEIKTAKIKIISQLTEIERSFDDMNIEQIFKSYKWLNEEAKNKIDKWKKLKANLDHLIIENQNLDFAKPVVNVNANIKFNKSTPPRIITSNTKEDFRMGVTVETINFNALCNGYQISLCKGITKPNPNIFLLPKVSSKSAFTLSNHGVNFRDSVKNLPTQYIAQITDFLYIQGGNIKFWEDLFKSGEFNLWDVKDGPYKYFENKSKQSRQYLWIMRVYKMDFILSKNEDFKRGPRGNASIINMNTLSKIQSDFTINKYTPVVEIESFKKKLEKIKDIIKKHQ